MLLVLPLQLLAAGKESYTGSECHRLAAIFLPVKLRMYAIEWLVTSLLCVCRHCLSWFGRVLLCALWRYVCYVPGGQTSVGLPTVHVHFITAWPVWTTRRTVGILERVCSSITDTVDVFSLLLLSTDAGKINILLSI